MCEGIKSEGGGGLLKPPPPPDRIGLTEFFEYYKSRSTSVYVAFLDASKAFDKISHWTLFRKLIDRGVPLYLVNILCYRYQKE